MSNKGDTQPLIASRTGKVGRSRVQHKRSRSFQACANHDFSPMVAYANASALRAKRRSVSLGPGVVRNQYMHSDYRMMEPLNQREPRRISPRPKTATAENSEPRANEKAGAPKSTRSWGDRVQRGKKKTTGSLPPMVQRGLHSRGQYQGPRNYQGRREQFVAKTHHNSIDSIPREPIADFLSPTRL